MTSAQTVISEGDWETELWSLQAAVLLTKIRSILLLKQAHGRNKDSVQDSSALYT